MNASTKAQTETTTGSILAEIGPFAKHETATRNHVRTLAERIETGLATAIEALASAGAAPVPSSATYGVALAHVSAEVWANPAWTRAKSGESAADERAGEIRESADFAARQVLMNVAPAHQAPYRAEVIIRSAGAIVHAEVLMVIGIAGCETESGFIIACLKADSDTGGGPREQGAPPPGLEREQRHRRVGEPGDRWRDRPQRAPDRRRTRPGGMSRTLGPDHAALRARRGLTRHSRTASATPKRRAIAMSSRTRAALAEASASPSSE